MKVHIIGHPRSGSSYCQSIFSESVNMDELNLIEPFRYPVRRQLFARHPVNAVTVESANKELARIADAPHVTVKNHISHLKELYKINLLDKLLSIKFDKTIGIMRKNIFETSLSLAIAKQKRFWGTHMPHPNQWVANKYKVASIIVSDKMFIHCLDTIANDIEELLENKYNIKYDHIIFYEDLTFDLNNDYVNIVGEPFKSKIEPRYVAVWNKKEIVKNYDHLKEVFSDWKKNNIIIFHKNWKGELPQ
jgi:hypothetical protein